MFKLSSKKLILGLGLSLSLSLITGASTTKEVSLIQDGRKVRIETGAKTIEDLVKEQNILIEQGQVTFPNDSKPIEENMEIEIKEGYEVEVVDNGEKSTYSVSSRKVADIVEELHIVLGPQDSIEPPMDTVLEEGYGLVINRSQDKVVEEDIKLPFETIEEENPQMYVGERKVIQSGQEGIKREKVLVHMVNGERRSSYVISSAFVQESIPEIVQVGTKPKENMIKGKKYTKKIVMKGSAYDPSAGSRTAMGTRARVGAVAVDPKVIPLGTKLYIESADGFPTYGFAVAEDTGGAIKGNRIDLFYNTSREAYSFGRRNVVVYVLADE